MVRNASSHFWAAAIKIARAQSHLQSLKSEIDTYFETGGAQVVVELDPQLSASSYGEAVAFVFWEKRPVPSVWAAIIGDLLHNLRSSLDLIAFEMHRITGGDPKEIKKVYFPFCDEQAGLKEMIARRRLAGIGPAFTKAQAVS